MEQIVSSHNSADDAERQTYINNGTSRVSSPVHRFAGGLRDGGQPAPTFMEDPILPRLVVEFRIRQKKRSLRRIDRKRKFLGTIFLRALGLRFRRRHSENFLHHGSPGVRDKKLFWTLDAAATSPRTDRHETRAQRQIEIGRGSGALRPQAQRRDPEEIQKQKSLKSKWTRPTSRRVGGGRHVDTTTGEVLIEANSEITADKVAKIWNGVMIDDRVLPRARRRGPVISQTLRRDSITSPSEALIEIYRKLRPGDPPTLDTATSAVPGHVLPIRASRLLRVAG